MEKLKNIIKESYAGIFISLCLSYVLLFYEPLNIFVNNLDDFWFDLGDFFFIALLQFLVGFLILSIIFIIARLINKKFYCFVIVCSLIGTICTYIQGNFFVGSLPEITGAWVSFDSFKTEKMISLLLWIIVGITILILLWKFKFKTIEKISKYVSLIIILMISSTFVVLFSKEGVFKDKAGFMATYENFGKMSSDKNFIIFIVDTIDSNSFNNRLELSGKQDKVFEDFTYYPDALGVYPFTKYSVPFILSGIWYQNDRSYDEYLNDVYDNSKLFEELEDNGYELNIYRHDLYQYNGNNSERFKNLSQDAKIDYETLLKQELQLIMYKYLPYQLKWRAKVETVYLKNALDNDDKKFFTFDNVDNFDKIKEIDTEVVEDKQFKLIHIQGGHVPYNCDASLNTISSGGSYYGNLDATITIIETYLNKLKESGVYDNSVIIIMSDHGVGENPLYRSNPILFVKGYNEKHDYQVSDKKVSYVDLMDAYNLLLEDKQTKDLFNNDNTERRFLSYDGKTPEIIKEYKFTGNAWNHDGFTPTGKEYILK